MQNNVLPWSVSRSSHHSEQSARSTGDLRHTAWWQSHTDPLPRRAIIIIIIIIIYNKAANLHLIVMYCFLNILF